MFNIVTVKKTLFNETSLWASRVQAAGGGFEANSVAIANNLVRQILNASFGPKVIYLLPMLGTGVGAPRVPLLDALNVGSATNTAFVNADFSQSTGLQGNGSTKYLTAPLKPSQLGLTNNGGLGYWENNISFGANVEPIGCYNTAGDNRFVLDLRSNLRAFRWGAAANGASDAIAAANGHYYGQRISATSREVFFNAASLGTNTTNDATAGSNTQNMDVVGSNESGSHAPWPGRCAVAYMTDGTLTASEIAAFDALLRAYLLGPTGKPQS